MLISNNLKTTIIRAHINTLCQIKCKNYISYLASFLISFVESVFLDRAVVWLSDDIFCLLYEAISVKKRKSPLTRTKGNKHL